MLNIRHHFTTEKTIHLNNAAMGPMSIPAARAVAQYNQIVQEQGSYVFPTLTEEYTHARERFAELVGANVKDVAMMQTTAVAISQVALGMNWQRGDEIVLWEDEYPSNVYPWLVAAKRYDLTIKWIKSPSDFALDTQWFLDAITPKTRVVAVSFVQYRTGAMVDLKEISDAAHKVGAWLVVDGIQGVGVIPFDLLSMGVDALCMGSWKWLCGAVGHGFLALAPGISQELTPILHGSLTYGELYEPIDTMARPKGGALKFEPGSPDIMGAIATCASVEIFLNANIYAINQHALNLALALKQTVMEQGYTLLGNFETDSPIVTFREERPIVQALSEKLNQARISHTLRDETIRLAPHGFNTMEEIAQVQQLLKRS